MKSNLIRLSLFALILVMSASLASATPSCSATTLSTTYTNSDGTQNGYVCDINQLEFSNFQYSGDFSASNIHVVPITTAGFEGLDFTGNFAANSTNPLTDIDVSFTVTALSGVLTDIHIDLNAVNTTGNGEVNYIEQFCNYQGTCQIYVDKPNTDLSTSILLSQTPLAQYGPITSLNITKDVSLTANNGTATLSNFDNYYSHTAVPEPRTVSILLGLGLLGAVVISKKRQAARS